MVGALAAGRPGGRGGPEVRESGPGGTVAASNPATLYACDDVHGNVRMGDTAQCKLPGGGRLVDWATVGVPGHTGPTGATGSTGPTGPQGPAGTDTTRLVLAQGEVRIDPTDPGGPSLSRFSDGRPIIRSTSAWFLSTTGLSAAHAAYVRALIATTGGTAAHFVTLTSCFTVTRFNRVLVESDGASGTFDVQH